MGMYNTKRWTLGRLGDEDVGGVWGDGTVKRDLPFEEK
jgi:hypothetical protein